MGQIVSSAAKPKRCNLNKLSQLVTPAAGEHILVSSDNSMNAAGQGNFDCYIVGDGTTAATALQLKNINESILSLIPDGDLVFANPLSAQQNIYIKANGTTASSNGWFISEPISLKKGETISGTGRGNSCAWLSYATPIDGIYRVIYAATAYSAPFTWTATEDCEVVISGNDAVISKYSISKLKQETSPISAWEALQPTVEAEIDVALVDNKKITGANTAYLGAETNDADYKATDFVDVEGIDVINVSVCGTTATSNNYGVAFYDENKTAIARSGITFSNENENNNDLRSLKVPTGAKYMRATIWKNIGNFRCYIINTSLLAEKIQDASQYGEQIQEAKQMSVSLDNGMKRKVKSQNLLEAFHDFRYLDIMYLTGNSNAPLTKIGIFNPTSATATTLTFGSDDAACLDKQLALVCKTDADDYYICQFTAASDGVVTLLYDYGVNIDLLSVVACMALHDTINGGNGQHLSPWGYKAVAQAMARQSQSKYWMANRVIDGLVIASCGVTAYNKPNIVDLDGNLVKEVTYNSLVAFGGPVNCICTENSGKNKIDTGGWCTKVFSYAQNAVGAKIRMSFPQERTFDGFVKIVCQSSIEQGIKVNVYDANENLIGSQYAPRMFAPLYFDVENKNGIVVEVETLIAAAKFRMTSVSIVENYSAKIKPIDETSVVACFGSSNTQYPPSNANYINLVAGDPFNELVIRPDGTTGDGYGYYPKELAKVTGAIVDDWGKSGEWTTYGLSHIKALFDTKRYTHVILSFFANDINGSSTYEKVIENIWEMCEYVKGHGAIPVMLTSYGTASSGQNTGYGRLHEFLQLGVSNPNIVWS